jgi:glycine/D-amino acid oxidase-like deaminating enzyme
MARPPVDVAVVGGGIAGTATAAFLAEAGRTVRLYEADAIAAGASGRNSGIVQHPFDPVLADLYRRTLGEYRLLADASDGAFRIEAEPAGLLYVGHDPALAERTARDWTAAWPTAMAEVVAGPALRALEPALAPGLAACRLDIGYPVAPAAATEAFAVLARRRGAEFAIGASARPALQDGRVTGIRVDDQVDPAGVVVVAGGPWTPSIVDPAGVWRPIRPSWGVVAGLALDGAPRHGLAAIDITIEPADADPRTGPPAGSGVVRDADVEFSLVPAAGSSSLGSTFLPHEPDPAAWLDALRRVGSRYVPGVADAPVTGLRRCARPVSRDGRPLVGPAPWADGLWIVAGHGPWGLSTGPGSARLVSDAILGGAPVDGLPSSLAADRFGQPVSATNPDRTGST